MNNVGMELNEDTQGIWFVTLPENDSDWLATISKIGDGFKLIYRFRYRKDDKVWDSKDEKNWYEVTGSSFETGMSSAKLVARQLAIKGGGEHFEYLREGKSLERLFYEFGKCPYMNVKVLEEAAQVNATKFRS